MYDNITKCINALVDTLGILRSGLVLLFLPPDIYGLGTTHKDVLHIPSSTKLELEFKTSRSWTVFRAPEMLVSISEPSGPMLVQSALFPLLLIGILCAAVRL